MTSPNPPQTEPRALEIVESGVELLRAASTGDFLIWVSGAAPFGIGLLHFWADMSRGTAAGEHLVPSSLGLDILYLWF
jgi:hypothetical protein